MTKKPILDAEIVEVNGVKGIKRGAIVSVMLPMDKLVLTSWNANVMKPAEFIRLKKTIAEDGFLDPLSVIPVDNGYFTVNGGEHRYKAAKELGLAELPCEIMTDEKWKDVDLQKLQSVRFNVIHGNMNPDKFLDLYNRAVEVHGKEAVADLMGFTSQDGIDKIVKQVSKSMRDTLPPELAEKFDKEAKDVKTVHDLEKIIDHIFKEHGDTLAFNFMVFSYGNKEHTYCQISKKTNDSLKKALELVKIQKLNMDDVLATALSHIINMLSEETGGPNF